MSTGTLEFLGSTRFRVVRRLGAGGTGIVYAVHDQERDEMVALKTMRWKDSSTIYLLKREFRSSAELAHPNLVTLHELIGDAQNWFFTMELVDGVSFVEYVRQDGFNVDRLRSALLQLTRGVNAIHGAGKVHRDLKPSNVLVTPGGRVVVLDFGISTDLEQTSGQTTFDRKVVGTLAYMSPEQTEGIYAASSDWYAIGVMLYEAMTGRLPFDGSIVEILWQKATKDPVPPDVLVPDLPADLNQLCLDLLRRVPEERPDGEQVLQRLGGSRAEDQAPVVAPINVAVIGRESQLTELAGALAATGAGEAVSVYVHGHSGIGKSALIEEFLQRFVPEDKTLVLTGRCYVRESVPYKAMDGVIDRLSRYLRGLPDAEVDQLITPDMRILTRLFPVLEGVRAIEELPLPELPIQDPVQLRRRGFAALRELFARITKITPVVIYIDDLQWSDAESLVLLEDLLSPPAPPPLLLIASFRSEDIDARPFLRGLLDRTRTTGYREVKLGPLSEADTRRLARTFAGAQAHDTTLIGAVVRESMGNPFLVEQLVRHALLTRDDRGTDHRTVRVEDMLNARMAQLPVGARDFLETLAVAARPIDATVAYDAAELVGDKSALVRQLEAERLLRRSGVPEALELAHDWIRETIASQIADQEIRRCHLRLAEALEQHDVDDPEALYEHYTAAGESAKAGAYAEHAGDRAERALAFDRAAELYQHAIALATPERIPELWMRRADALADAGRGPEAANSYFEAAKRHEGIASLDLRRRAAEQLLRSGYVDQGLDAVRAVLASVGYKLARSPRHALMRLLVRRALMRLRGLGYKEKSADEIAPFTLSRIDVCWSVAIGLSRVDTIRAMDFQVLQLLLALRAGEPYRVARALASEAGFLSTGGGRTRARVTKLTSRTLEMAERVNDTRALAFARFATGIANFYVGEFDNAVEECGLAERLLRERCTGVVWEINTAQTFACSSLFYLGEYAELARRVPLRLREAKERGDLYAAADVMAGRPNIIWLVEDDERTAREYLRSSMRPWSLQGFHLQHYFALFVEGNIDLYAGEAMAAWTRTTERWRDLKRSIVLRAELIKLEALHLRARCALAAAQSDPSLRQRLLVSAERDARRIQRAHMPWANPLADLILAAVSVNRGDPQSGVRHLDRAIKALDENKMCGYAAAARRRSGELLGGTQGADLIGAADAWFSLQGVVKPERMTGMLAPGFGV